VRSGGTDNAIFRLGDQLAIRMPRIDWASGQAEKEQRWLPLLEPSLPLPIPTPVGLGMPGFDYPWRWSVSRWLGGVDAVCAAAVDVMDGATQMARFIAALRTVDASNGPRGGGRGGPLAVRDAETRSAMARLDGSFDIRAMTAAWDAALAVPVWTGPPVWLHGDLHPGNLLVRNGRVSGVIDFGCMGLGDPACDVMVAWTFLTHEVRRVFRRALDVDDATWARGRGWALSTAVIALPYYLGKNPVIVRLARRTIAEALRDDG
jgi:aminoglycoside phosphotransferase (APT) family kinase protein